MQSACALLHTMLHTKSVYKIYGFKACENPECTFIREDEGAVFNGSLPLFAFHFSFLSGALIFCLVKMQAR